MKLTLHSEQFRPEGGAVAQGMSRALGTPRLDNISVLVREAVQNSWDARKKHGDKVDVDFNVRIGAATREQWAALKRSVFAQHPPNHPIELAMSSAPKVMFMEDRGTVGLGGPVFMEPQHGGGNRNFINFFRLFGRESEVGAAGGTYGYGKAVFFNASRVSTILVHTKCLESDGSTEERLMGMSLRKPTPKSLETGRYWWGVKSKRGEDAVGPLVGKEAAELAADLGFSPFRKDQSGTSIMVIQPRLEVSTKDTDDDQVQDDPAAFARCIAESLMMWFWPRVLGGADGKGRLRFSVFLEGKPVPVPDPQKAPPFSTYSLALEHLVSQVRRGELIPQPHSVQEVASQRPAARLGWLSMVRTPVLPRPEWAVNLIDDHAMSDQLSLKDGHGSLHHIALIRSSGQVIRYLPCREYPDGAVEYGGIFLVEGDRDGVDDAFALAEPPSHDDWVWENLEKDWHRRFVRIGLREIREKAQAFADMGKAALVGGAQDPLGALSSELGELLSAPGSGAEPGTRGTGGGGGGGGGSSGAGPGQLLGNGSLEMWEGEPAFILPFKVQLEGGAKEGTVKAHPRVLVAGGVKESEAPEGAEEPRVLAWCAPDGRVVRSKRSIKVRERDSGEWRVVVSVPKDAMIAVSLESSNTGSSEKAD